MSKVLRYILNTLFTAELLLFLLFAVSYALPQYEVTLVYPTVFSALRFAVSCAAAVLFCRYTAVCSKTERLFSLLLLLFSAVNGCIFIFESYAWTVLLFCVACVICYTVVLWKCMKSAWVREISLLLCFLVVVILPIYCVFIFTAIGAREDTVVQTSVSPQGTYVAEVIESDQGALGGDTVVAVRRNKKLFFAVCEVRPSAQEIYRGGFGEAATLCIQWHSDSVLQIQGETYSVAP